MDKRKDRRFQIRFSNIIFRKLEAICKVTNRTKTAVIEDLILSEYNKNKAYEKWFYANIDKKS